MAAPIENTSTSSYWGTLRSILTLSFDPWGIRDRAQEYTAKVRAFDPERRPEGWTGHWSARYGRIFTRTLERYPPFERTEREMLESVPRPMNETLDPAASSAELAGRDGHRLPWALLRSTSYDLLGWPGIVISTLLLAAVVFVLATRLPGLPPLIPPVQQQQQQQPLQQQPQQQQPQPQPQPQQQQFNPADNKAPPNLPVPPSQPSPLNPSRVPRG
jgi:hypothetical protein